MKRLILTALALVALSAIPARAADPIRIGATGNDTAAEVYYADELGFFKKRGLEVQIQNLRNGAAQAAAIAGGALDIGEQNIISMSHAHERGLTFKYIAPAADYVSSSSTTSLVIGKSSTIKSGKDLEGKTVAVNALGDLTQIGASAWIDKHGGDATKVKFIEMVPAEIGAALARGTIEAGVIPEPALTAAEDAGQVKLLGQPYDSLGERFLINGWFANGDWIKKNPETVKKFADAIYEAAKWANTHRAESAKIFAKHSKADSTVIARMRRATYGEKFDGKALQAVLDEAVRYKGITKSFPATELYDATL